MKKTFKKMMIIAGIGIISGATIISCNQRSKSNQSDNTREQAEETYENIEDRVHANYLEAKAELKEITADDPEFVTKLEIKLDELNQSLENLEDDTKAEGEELNEETKANIAKLKSEARILEEKVESWGEARTEDMENIRNEIADDFNRLVASLDTAKI
jgi:gas vesicle protein